jgi:hypothetical protein
LDTSGAPSREYPDELHASEIADLVAQFLGCRDDRHAQQLQRVAAFPYRLRPCDAEHAKGFHRAVFGLGDDGAALVQRGAAGVDRVEVIVFAPAAPVGAVWAVDFEDGDTGFGQTPGQAGAVGADALDADPGQLAELGDPGQQRP